MGGTAHRKAESFYPRREEVTKNQRFQVIEACSSAAHGLELSIHAGVEAGAQYWRPAMQWSRWLQVLRLGLGGSILGVSVAILAGFGGYENSIVAAAIGFSIAAAMVLIYDGKLPNSPT